MATDRRDLKTRSLNVRLSDDDFEYLARHVEEDAPTLSDALRQAIMKARALDEALMAGRLPELVFNPATDELVDPEDS